jgi:hypothetical protein
MVMISDRCRPGFLDAQLMPIYGRQARFQSNPSPTMSYAGAFQLLLHGEGDAL